MPGLLLQRLKGLSNYEKGEQLIMSEMGILQLEDIVSLDQWAKSCLGDENPAQALLYAQWALLVAEAYKTASWVGKCHSRIAQAFELQGKLEESSSEHKSAIRMCNEVSDKEALAVVTKRYAHFLIKHDQFEEGLDYLRQAITLYRKIEETDTIFQKIIVVGVDLINKQEYELAQAIFDEGLLLFDDISNLEEKATLLTYLGSLYCAKGNFAEGEEVLGQALIIAEETANIPLQVQIHTDIGLSALEQNNLQKAQTMIEEAQNLASDSKDPGLRAWVSGNLATVYEKGKHNPEKVISCLKRAVAEWNTAGRGSEESRALRRLAGAKMEIGSLTSAISHLELSGRIDLKANRIEEAATSLMLASDAYRQLGDLSAATESMIQGLKLLQDRPQSPVLVSIYQVGAKIKHEQEDIKQAISYLRDACKVAELFSDNEVLAELRISLAQLLSEEGSLQQAFDLYKQVLESLRFGQTPDTPMVAQILFSMGRIQEQLGTRKSGFDLETQALEVFPQYDDRGGITTSASFLGEQQHKNRHIEAAIDYFEEVEQLVEDPHIISTTRSRLAALNRELGELQAAEDWEQEALRANEVDGDVRIRSRILNNLGNYALARNDFSSATSYFRQSLDLLETQVEDNEERIKVMQNLGSSIIAQGNLNEGIAYVEQALRLALEYGLEEMRDVITSNLISLRQMQKNQDLQKDDSLKDLASAQQHPDVQYYNKYQKVVNRDWFEATPAIAELEALATALGFENMTVDESKGYLVEKQELIHEAVHDALVLGQENLLLPMAIVDTAKSLIARNMLFHQRRKMAGETNNDTFHIMGTDTKPHLAVEYIRRFPETAIFNFYLGPKGDLWAITAIDLGTGRPIRYGGIRIVPANSESGFADKLKEYASRYPGELPDFELQSELLKTVGDALIPYLLNTTRRVRRLILIPHRELHLLPLHAMFTEAGKERLYLSDLVPETVYESCLAELVFGNLRFGENDVSPSKPKMLAALDMSAPGLDWIDVERQHYEKVVRGLGYQVDIVTDAEQIPEDFRAYVHITFSCHAVSDPYSWGASHIRFGQSKITASTIVDAWELQRRPLITLSACEGGSNQVVVEYLDEYLGLDRALRIAGARQVIAPLWPIKDRLGALASIMLPMMVFVQGVTPALALRAFQTHLRLGTWKESFIPVDELDAIEDRDKEVADSLRDISGRFRELDAEAFIGVDHWSAFRCYGG